MSELFIASFDSASSMAASLAFYLQGKDFPNLGIGTNAVTPVLRTVTKGVNRLPERLREIVYTVSGAQEAITVRRLASLRAHKLEQWAVSKYGGARFPAIFIGSSNGAMIHLCAALRCAWLPQTFLVGIKRNGDPDDPGKEAKWGKIPADILLRNEPDLQLHHMLDPVHDRLMSRKLGYFRVKLLKLQQPYKEFMRSHLLPGGMIIIFDCGLKWPVKKIDDRYYFQFGGYGGATNDDLFKGTEETSEFLSRYRSRRTRWETPEPDYNMPEAEWGYEDILTDDICQYAKSNGFSVRRISIKEPVDLSPFTADFYRSWNEQRNIKGSRLLVETFILIEPYWTLKTGSIPFWLPFPTEPEAAAVEDYIGSDGKFEEIGITLFSHGVDSIRLAGIDRWKEIAAMARKRGYLLGTDDRAFPRDFAAFFSYHSAIKNKIRSRYAIPGAVDVQELFRKLEQDAKGKITTEILVK